MKIRFVCLFSVLLISFSMVLPTSVVESETLNEYIAQAERNRAAYAEAQEQKELTEEERDAAIKEREQVQKDIETIKSQLETIEVEIAQTQENIKEKDAEMKEIMSFVQLSNGTANYLEYIFGATDFTDFIYRISVAEQLESYNDNLIKEYEQAVKDLDAQQKELNDKTTELTNKENELNVLEARLNNEIQQMQEGILDYEAEYEVIMSYVNTLQKLGCRGDEDMDSCQARLNPPVVSANGTYMPIAKGRVTSDYGWRDLDGNGSLEDYHTGIDFSNGVHGDSVYPVADGIVISIRYPSYYRQCGNHIVYVYHNINGREYTTSYWHLTDVDVQTGQIVTYNTRLGSMGGLNSEDSCAYGTHVHLNLFNGKHFTNSGRIDPRILMPQIPSRGVYFSSRSV